MLAGFGLVLSFLFLAAEQCQKKILVETKQKHSTTCGCSWSVSPSIWPALGCAQSPKEREGPQCCSAAAKTADPPAWSDCLFWAEQTWEVQCELYRLVLFLLFWSALQILAGDCGHQKLKRPLVSEQFRPSWIWPMLFPTCPSLKHIFIFRI